MFRTPIKFLVLAVVLAAATLPTREARAEDVTPKDVISALEKAYSLYQKFAGNQLSLREATDEVLAAIESAKDEIIDRLDGIASIEGAACAKSIIISAGDMAAASQQTRENLALDAVSCMALIEQTLEIVEEGAAVDRLGFALNALGPVALMARAQAGFSPTSDIPDMVVNGNYAVIAKLYPHCVTMTLWGDSGGYFVEQNIRCTAYNGDRGWAFSWLGDPAQPSKKEQAADDATRNTSRAVAQAMQPLISNLYPPRVGTVRFSTAVFAP